MLHQPAAPSQSDPAYLFKRQLGVWMFLVYSVFYVGFVVINLAWPSLMGLIVLAGLLAYVSSFPGVFIFGSSSLLQMGIDLKKRPNLCLFNGLCRLIERQEVEPCMFAVSGRCFNSLVTWSPRSV